MIEILDHAARVRRLKAGLDHVAGAKKSKAGQDHVAEVKELKVDQDLEVAVNCPAALIANLLVKGIRYQELDAILGHLEKEGACPDPTDLLVQIIVGLVDLVCHAIVLDHLGSLADEALQNDPLLPAVLNINLGVTSVRIPEKSLVLLLQTRDLNLNPEAQDVHRLKKKAIVKHVLERLPVYLEIEKAMTVTKLLIQNNFFSISVECNLFKNRTENISNTIPLNHLQFKCIIL